MAGMAGIAGMSGIAGSAGVPGMAGMAESTALRMQSPHAQGTAGRPVGVALENSLPRSLVALAAAASAAPAPASTDCAACD